MHQLEAGWEPRFAGPEIDRTWCVDYGYYESVNKGIVELAAWVALENYRSRFNAGLGLRSQGFSDSCEVPMRTSSRG